MCWWLEDNTKLINENKRLVEKNKELQDKINSREDDTIILDIVNAYLVDKKLIEDFDKWIKSHSMEEVYRVKDKIRGVWEDL